MLRYSERYLQLPRRANGFSGWADSPENFLAYAEFDGTYDTASSSARARRQAIHSCIATSRTLKISSRATQAGRTAGARDDRALNYLASKG